MSGLIATQLLDKNQVTEQTLKYELSRFISSVASVKLHNESILNNTIESFTQKLVYWIDEAMRMSLKEILCLYHYFFVFEEKVKIITTDSKTKDKIAKSMIYKKMLQEFSSENFDYYRITDKKLCSLCKLEHGDEKNIKDTYKAESYFIKCEQHEIEIVAYNMTKSDKILTSEYLDWHAKLTGLPRTHVLEANLLINLMPGNKVSYLFFPEQCEENGLIFFEVKSDSELIVKSILEHFSYLKFQNSFRGIDNYNFASPQPWSLPCPICDGKYGNYGLHGSWYCENGNQLPYNPELVKLYFQDKLEYCLTCNTLSNKFKFTIVA
ncbi:hypothetical protein RclHR1_01740001 [Rhizophagus clarus]|uniref:Uncharacterized protein n=1 Tax=Rhizophagus clarus TaxID=94130 RepID=A0A2Z6QYQ6_9GLOM|nr:hypothetical protein RclHR1_01740001 [Rhizophagus clarus]